MDNVVKNLKQMTDDFLNKKARYTRLQCPPPHPPRTPQVRIRIPDSQIHTGRTICRIIREWHNYSEVQLRFFFSDSADPLCDLFVILWLPRGMGCLIDLFLVLRVSIDVSMLNGDRQLPLAVDSCSCFLQLSTAAKNHQKCVFTTERQGWRRHASQSARGCAEQRTRLPVARTADLTRGLGSVDWLLEGSVLGSTESDSCK